MQTGRQRVSEDDMEIPLSGGTIASNRNGINIYCYNLQPISSV